MIVSGGWDNCLVFSDVRARAPISTLYGPHIVGDSIDFFNEEILLAGSFDSD